MWRLSDLTKDIQGHCVLGWTFAISHKYRVTSRVLSTSFRDHQRTAFVTGLYMKPGAFHHLQKNRSLCTQTGGPAECNMSGLCCVSVSAYVPLFCYRPSKMQQDSCLWTHTSNGPSLQHAPPADRMDLQTAEVL